MNPTNEETTSSVDLSTAKINRRSIHTGLKTILSLLTVCFLMKFAATPPARAQALGADNNRRYDQNAYLESHDAFTTESTHYLCWGFCNQDRSIDGQLNGGVRSLDLRIWKVRQFKYALNYQARVYNSKGDHKDTFDKSLLINESYGDHDPQVVLGHHVYDTGLGHLIGGLGLGFSGALYPLEKFSNRLKKIREWVEDHPNEVVTLNVDSNVPKDDTDLTREAFKDAGISEQQMFILGNDYVNQGLPPTQGRPGGLRPKPDGWWFPMDGMPTLQHLINNGKRLVYYDDRTWNNTSFHNVMVDTIYGNHSVPTGCEGEHHGDWADENGKAIDDFRVPLFMMQHVREDPAPTYYYIKCVQDIKWLKQRLTDIEAKWHRLPNLVRVDHAAKTSIDADFDIPFDGPKAFVKYLNQRWAEQPTITPTYTLSPQPNSFGWNNTFVSVLKIWGVSSNPGTDLAKQVIYSIFAPPIGNSATPSILEDRRVLSEPATFYIPTEGKYVISFYVIGLQGNASNRGYVDIWIDMARPTISGYVDRAPNVYGWYRADVKGSFTYQDAVPTSNPQTLPSGIDPNPLNTTPTVTLSIEGRNQTITGKATDKAGNVNTASLTGINLDKTKPSITYKGNAGKYTPDQFINITCTPSDSLSGVRVHTCKNISGEGYDFVVGSQKITPHAYSANATDYADNAGNGSTSFTVEVNQQAVSNLTARFVSNAGVANSLQQKLKSATQAEARRDLRGKRHHVEVYVKELQNHIGRFVSSKNAATLIRLARAF